MAERIKVHLAEVPTDVLVYLAQHDACLHTVADLATALAPADADHAVASLSSALALLRDGGYVYRNGGYQWGVTTAGMKAVVEAQRGASEVAPTACPSCGAPTWNGQHRNGHQECVIAEVEVAP